MNEWFVSQDDRSKRLQRKSLISRKSKRMTK